ncbi:unnamed protein product, partial [Rhizoctonia solani]
MTSFVPPPLHSTPTQVRVQSASNTLKTSELQNELRDNIVPNVEFDLFVKEVLKFSGDKYGMLVQSVREEKLGSAADWSQLFAPIIASGGEPFIYDPLIKLVHWIQDQLREKLSWESSTDLKFRNTWSLGGSEADQKPGITGVSGPQDSYPKWKDALLVWEVKHKSPVSHVVSHEHLFPVNLTPRPYSDPGFLVSKKRGAPPESLLAPARKKNKSNSASQMTKANTNTNNTSRKSESPLEQLLSYSLEAMTAQ